MSNIQHDYRINRTETLKMLYRAHETIAEINVRVAKLYESATSVSPSQITNGASGSPNPKRFENVLIQIAHLEDMKTKLLKQRAKFDVFDISLAQFHHNILKLRCAEYRSWKYIAIELDVSTPTVKRAFKKICDKAEKAGLFEVSLDPDEEFS